MSNEPPILECRKLSKSFSDADDILVVLNKINFSIYAAQTIAVLGASGSGKSTLLHLLGGLDTPSFGQVLWKNENINKMREAKKCWLRNRYLGFIYQFHHLLSEFTALENVAMPLLIGGVSGKKSREIAVDFLKKINLNDRANHKTGELSGGERQRIAVARALVTNPSCVLADEPTGNLDLKSAESVLQVMLELQRELGTSFVIVTHDEYLAKTMQFSYTLKNGQLV